MDPNYYAVWWDISYIPSHFFSILAVLGPHQSKLIERIV